jgi:hypothetical protein
MVAFGKDPRSFVQLKACCLMPDALVPFLIDFHNEVRLLLKFLKRFFPSLRRWNTLWPGHHEVYFLHRGAIPH